MPVPNLTKSGTSGAVFLIDTSGNDVFRGYEENDNLCGKAGDDIFEVGFGDGFDTVDGDVGTDKIIAVQSNILIGLAYFMPSNSIEVIDANSFSNVGIKAPPSGGAIDLSSTTLINIVQIQGSDSGDLFTGSQGSDNTLTLDNNNFTYKSKVKDIIGSGNRNNTFFCFKHR